MTQTLGASPPTPLDLWKSCNKLESYLLRLTKNRDDADDLITDTWIQATRGLHTFVTGSNLDAWLRTIARNEHIKKKIRFRKEIEDMDGKYAQTLICQPEQEWQSIGRDILAAFEKLPAIQCRAVKLSVADGESYEYIAELEHVPLGTIRSRINRGRATLMVLLCEEVPSPDLSIQ